MRQPRAVAACFQNASAAALVLEPPQSLNHTEPMPDKRDLSILSRPEPGETKEEFKARLRKEMGATVGESGLVFPPTEKEE